MTTQATTTSSPPPAAASTAPGAATALWRRLGPPGTTSRHVVLALAGLVAVVGLTFVLEPYRNYQVAVAAAYLCATAGLTVLVGRSGQLSLGHAGLMAGGAYGFGLTTNALAGAGVGGLTRLVVPFVVGVAAAGVLGLLLGLAGARLHGPYLAGLTLAFVVALPAVATTLSSVLGGDAGFWIEVERRPEALRDAVGAEQWHAWFAVTGAALVLLALTNLVRSHYGARMVAVRDDEAAARLVGIDPMRVKVATFVVTAIGAGLGGCLLAHATQTASPGAYSMTFSLLLVVAVVVGGLGRLGGAAVDTVLVVLLPDVIGRVLGGLELSAATAQRLDGNLAVGVFGVLLVLIMIITPGGLQALAGPLRRALLRR